LVLDAEGLSKLALGQSRAVSFAMDAHELQTPIVVAATTLTEVMRGGPRDAPFHRVLRRIDIAPIDETRARQAGELLERARLSGHGHALDALDALVAAVALAQPRPALLLTSDMKDMEVLTHEPGRPRRERVTVVHV
jgi:predicted nucleic acid-binding protein